jgi:Outer membrane protein beta-barrel domain
MKRIVLIISVFTAIMVCGGGEARAQFGFGAGIAAVGDNIGQAGGEVSDLFSKDSITPGDVSGDIGFYLSGRAKFGLGPINLIGDISYVYFQSQQVTLESVSVNSADTTVRGEFNVGTSMIPINVGAVFALPTPVVKPYIGGQLSYTFVSRTYAFVSGAKEIEDKGIQNKSAGDPEFGLSINGGVEFALGVASLDVGARYNMMNLFTADDGEKSMRYLQVGASVFF